MIIMVLPKDTYRPITIIYKLNEINLTILNCLVIIKFWYEKSIYETIFFFYKVIENHFKFITKKYNY